MANGDVTPEQQADMDWLARMRKRQADSYQRFTEQQGKAEERFGEISNEIFADIMGIGEKKEPESPAP